MSVSAFDHPILSALVGDEDFATLFSVAAELAAILRFEAALAEAEAEEDLIPAEAAEAISAALKRFKPDIGALNQGVAQDGVVVPALLRQVRETLADEHRVHLHFGGTSQDVIDTALAIRLSEAASLLAARLDTVVETLDALEKRDGGIEVMAHTRMQAAIPITAARKIASWREPLMRHRARLETVRKSVATLTFGGAAGTLEKLGGKGAAVAARLARKLGLNVVAHARHSERDGIADLAAFLSLVTGSLGKMGQDVALMAQSEMGEVKLSTGGGSSAMPHKHNPVKAETLVTLARFNATLLSGMHHALVHENERSGAAWTLEWMLLPQMVVATGAALRTANDLAGGISFVGRRKS
ncbi:3-carboxy-cis,cis-muconate cycloisomerase [Chelativorans sp. AA-79]|uniref:3-carboxy-cis,cis-muconate cycloisomerase n=1 Tax=Chelativorans sp. AA-79 TaxID=3028735 RepID=UPI0023F71C77|nr:3-carboxy-cis,cis-muconate cycloisomerase [Chelativorans sp. AA-79]WEX11303.1 3-carboxy-cis,cis-muconate cycloisomerase [Chelativorans sp. AA-79]